MGLRIYGNRLLKTPAGQQTRPTSARVREALFNIWQGDILHCHWLDLCTGSGALGAEALCRGAALVVGIEHSGPVCKIIQQNWQQVAHPGQQFQILRGDVLHQLPQLAGQQFDRIYFDPPYQSRLYEGVLRAIAQLNLLAATGELAVEHQPKYWQAEAPPGLMLRQRKNYGTTALSFFYADPILTDERF